MAVLSPEVREPHLLNVVANLRNFAARVPLKYRGSIEKAGARALGSWELALLLLRCSLPCVQALKTEGGGREKRKPIP